jgi:hypothetical protein
LILLTYLKGSFFVVEGGDVDPLGGDVAADMAMMHA